jgi:HAE1 family hydrophobic/amphiphilic exporter-1
MGWSLNTISLAAIALSIGMVVDSAIVVVDNISKNLEMGKTIKESALLGTKEVGSAIGASTLTTVVIFLPLVFISGIIGIMFKQMGGVVTITLLSSLFCALMLIPLLSFKILKKPKIKVFEELFLKLEEKYLFLLKKALKNKKKTFLISASVIVFTLFLFPFMGSEFFPTEDTGDLQITFEMPVGTPLKKNIKMCEKIEKKALALIDNSIVAHSYWRAGVMDNSFGVAMGRKEGSHIGIYGMKLVKRDKRNRSTKELGRKIADAIKDFPEIVNINIEDGNPMSSIVFGGIKPITLEILGHDLKKTEKLAKKIQTIAKKIPGTKDVTISRGLGKPELIVKTNRQKALFLGVDIFNLSTTLRTLFYGKEITNFKKGEKSYPVFMQLDESEKSLENIQNTEIMTKNNTKIRLDNIATLKESRGPMEIERKNNERVIKIDIDTYKRSQGEILKNLKKKLSKLLIPKDIKIEFSGLVEHQKDSFKYIFYMLILGILLIYMVMASQFESLKDPFIIMFSVPFAIVGVIFALTVTNTSLSVMSLIGVLMLTGIAVNNAIVIVDCINRFRRENFSVIEAIHLAGKNRLRPVLITTLTTIFGMLPLVFNREEGAEMWKPFGIAVIGGLLVSTMITLILIPLLYKIFHKEKL